MIDHSYYVGIIMWFSSCCSAVKRPRKKEREKKNRYSMDSDGGSKSLQYYTRYLHLLLGLIKYKKYNMTYETVDGYCSQTGLLSRHFMFIRLFGVNTFYVITLSGIVQSACTLWSCYVYYFNAYSIIINQNTPCVRAWILYYDIK